MKILPDKLPLKIQKNILTKVYTYDILIFTKQIYERFYTMTLYDELYFEIKATGPKSEVKRFVSFLKSGELNEFFEFSSDYIIYDDDYAEAGNEQETSVILSNDDFGIEIDEFHTDEFLEVLCKASKNLYLKGQLFDIDDEEYAFVSEVGDSYYTNAKNIVSFNEDEDKPHEDEE